MTEKKTVKKTRAELQQSRKVKHWSKIWWKWILIWIFLFFILIIWLVFFFFFYLVKNPHVGKWLWLSIGAIKSIASVFAWIFFWTFFFLFLFLWLSYIYKLSTKPAWRFKNTVWIIIVFILWLINLWFGFYVFTNISNIKEDSSSQTNEVLVWYINLHEDKKALYNFNYPIIAPVTISFQLNRKIFDQYYLPQIKKLEWWNVKLISFSLQCGNWQKIKFQDYDFEPSKYCLYLKKWNYTARLTFSYLNPNWQKRTYNFPEKEISINSEAIFKTQYKLNDEKNEIIAWEIWDKIRLDISKIPLDLGLTKNDILIDFLWNGKFNKYKWLASFVYSEDWLYHIKIKIPNINYPTYKFPVRILPSTKPTCTISYKENLWKYIISINWESPNGAIVKYNYSVINMATNNVMTKGKKNKFIVNLNNWNSYKIKFIIQDIKWKKWYCEEIINLTDKITYTYNVKIENTYMNITTWSNIIQVNVPKLPSTFTVKMVNIRPNTYSEIWFDLDGDWEIDEKWTKLSIKLNKKENKEISTIVKDQYWNQTIKVIKFNINLKPVITVLNVNKYKWSAPLTVKFDASSSYVTKNNDSIAFFNWDFGDWEKAENTRQWVIKHTYKKSWRYTAKVTIETDLWYTWVATKEIIVFKPINTASIIFPNNLWWQINVWESLQIQLNASGPIKNVSWNFGDWNTFNCEWRECMNTSYSYKKPWLFTITAKITFTDWSPSITTKSKINVIDY